MRSTYFLEDDDRTRTTIDAKNEELTITIRTPNDVVELVVAEHELSRLLDLLRRGHDGQVY